MKATRANLLGEFTGKLDGLIYYKSRINGKLYVRKQWTFQNHPHHPEFAAIQRNLFCLKPSPAFIQDLKDYLYAYNRDSRYQGKEQHAWNNLYVKMMFALEKAFPGTVNLATLSRLQIVSQNLPCRTVKAAVEAGLLPVVKGYARFVGEL